MTTEKTRSRIGLVPQELTLEQFETVFNNVSYSRGLYGKKTRPTAHRKNFKIIEFMGQERSKIKTIIRRNETKSFNCQSFIS